MFSIGPGAPFRSFSDVRKCLRCWSSKPVPIVRNERLSSEVLGGRKPRTWTKSRSSWRCRFRRGPQSFGIVRPVPYPSARDPPMALGICWRSPWTLLLVRHHASNRITRAQTRSARTQFERVKYNTRSRVVRASRNVPPSKGFPTDFNPVPPTIGRVRATRAGTISILSKPIAGRHPEARATRVNGAMTTERRGRAGPLTIETVRFDGCRAETFNEQISLGKYRVTEPTILTSPAVLTRTSLVFDISATTADETGNNVRIVRRTRPTTTVDRRRVVSCFPRDLYSRPTICRRRPEKLLRTYANSIV